VLDALREHLHAQTELRYRCARHEHSSPFFISIVKDQIALGVVISIQPLEPTLACLHNRSRGKSMDHFRRP